MPPDNVLYKLVDRLEAQLPRDDHVKYDSRYNSTNTFIRKKSFKKVNLNAYNHNLNEFKF